MVECSANGSELYFHSDYVVQTADGRRGANDDTESSADQQMLTHDFACHTNHPLISSDFSDAFVAHAEATTDALGHWGANTICRYDSITSFLQAKCADARASGREAVIAMSQEALRLRTHPEHPVCRHPNAGSMSLGSCVFVSGDSPALYCAQGPADTRPYREYIFSSTTR